MDQETNLFEFSDYRAYLNACLALGRRERRFNLTQLSQVARVHPTFLSHILGGDKQLSLEQAVLISDFLGHSRLEQDYFLVLIQLDRAGSERLRQHWADKKDQLQREKSRIHRRLDKHKELNQEQRAEFYSSWLYVAVWVSTGIDGRQTLSQVARRFGLGRDRAEAILAFLTATGLCVRDGEHFAMGETHIHVPDDSPFVVKHHVNWRMKAIQRMDFRTGQELFFTAPMSVARKDYELIREKLTRTLAEIVGIAKSSRAEDVACLNIDFFVE